MEMQLFILGHVLLLGICAATMVICAKDAKEVPAFDFCLYILFLFVPLEIIYWILHWIFVP